MGENATAGKVHILPMGSIPASVIGAVEKALSETYGLEVLKHSEIPLPVASFNIERRQYLSFVVIEEIAIMRLEGIALGIADEDFYAQGLNFVFGEADREKQVAVISLARLRKEFYGGSPDKDLLIQRAVKEAVHEVGHVLGLAHCPNPACVMHFSNTISHTDLKSAEPCSLCSQIYKNVIRGA